MPTPSPACNGTCGVCQDEMDHKACWQTKKTADICFRYDICYQEKNITFYETKEAICGPDGLRDQLKLEYYGVLRIECILKALRLTTYPAEEYVPHFHDVIPALMPKDDNPDARMDAIDKCVERVMADYEPILCPIFCNSTSCNKTEPIYNVVMHSRVRRDDDVLDEFPPDQYERECEVVRLPRASLNMSGAAAYPAYWYDKVVPKNCASDCCEQAPPGYQRRAFPRFLVAGANQNCDETCAQKGLTCSAKNLRAHIYDTDDCAKMTMTMVDLGHECLSCENASENETWTPGIDSGGQCYTASRHRTVEQYDCTARAILGGGINRQRVCWCQTPEEVSFLDQCQQYEELAPEDDVPDRVPRVPLGMLDMEVV